VKFAEFIRDYYSPLEDNSGWVRNGNGYKKGSIPDMTIFTTEELYQYWVENVYKPE
jgi:hypothetical protein